MIGCGGVGLSAIQGAAIAGAAGSSRSTSLDAKLELARKFGATDTVNAKKGERSKQVQELTKGGVHYSFEAIGSRSPPSRRSGCCATAAPRP